LTTANEFTDNKQIGIYLLTQDHVYDTYDAVIVVANNANEAKKFSIEHLGESSICIGIF